MSNSTNPSARPKRVDVDPNESRCFITNQSTPVRLCHLVSQATDRETVAKLEHAWGIEQRKFDLDTKHNVLHLRTDWHVLFDDSQWLLVPEVKIIEDLKKMYLTDGYPTSNLPEQFENQNFNYYVVPTPSLREVICRFPDVNSHEHKTHAPPFSELGPLKSHIHPHYVIFNTGQKMGRFTFGELSEMSCFLSQNLSITIKDATSALATIQKLYVRWVENILPAHWEWQQPRVALPLEDDNSSSVTDDTVEDDDTTWIDYIYNWKKQLESRFGTADTRESDVLNNSYDEQLASYADEHARTPPSLGVWDSWKSAWDDHHSTDPNLSDRSRFSSNDWAVFKNGVYLTRQEHRQVAL